MIECNEPCEIQIYICDNLSNSCLISEETRSKELCFYWNKTDDRYEIGYQYSFAASIVKFSTWNSHSNIFTLISKITKRCDLSRFDNFKDNSSLSYDIATGYYFHYKGSYCVMKSKKWRNMCTESIGGYSKL